MNVEERAEELINAYKRGVMYPPPGLWQFQRGIAQALRDERHATLDKVVTTMADVAMDMAKEASDDPLLKQIDETISDTIYRMISIVHAHKDTPEETK